LANEGKLVAIVAASAAQDALCALQGQPLGKGARIIGRITAEHPRMVIMRTPFGTTRIVDMLAGEQLPRICEGHACTRSASPLRFWKRWTQKLASVPEKKSLRWAGCADVCV
jgi:hypothetical protein